MNGIQQGAGRSEQSVGEGEDRDVAVHVEARALRQPLDGGAVGEGQRGDIPARPVLFAAAEQLYGLTFTPRADLRGWNADTRVFEVHDEGGGAVGLYLLDPYARPSKRGGAWMDDVPAGVAEKIINGRLLGFDTE